MPKITPNFGSEEFACHDGTPYPEERLRSHLHPLCVVLEAIRAAASEQAGREVPLAVISGYRSLAWNDKVDGALASRHVEGDGADVQPMGMSPRTLHSIALRLHRAGKIRIGGLGLYRSWIHVDVRPGALVQWQGRGVGSEKA